MADKTISALTAASTPLAGTEVLPIVQSSTTKKVATDDLTVKNIRSNATTGILQVAGPAAAATRIMTVPDANFTAARTDAANSFTGDQTLATGNLVIGTAGKGIDFSATANGAGTMTSELLADYEEGTWTPEFAGSTTSPTGYNLRLGVYTKVGNVVTVHFRLLMLNSGVVSGSGDCTVVGLPYASKNISNQFYIGSIGYAGGWGASQTPLYMFMNPNVSAIGLFNTIAAVPVSAGNVVNNTYVAGSISYQTA